NFAQRIGFNDLRLACLRIDQLQRSEIGVFVAFDIKPLVARLELDWAAGLKNIAGINLAEAIGADAEEFRISVVGTTRGQPKVAFQVENPSRNALRVLAHQFLRASRELQLVEIVPGFIAVIQADVDRVGVTLRNIDNLDADAFQSGEIARS